MKIKSTLIFALYSLFLNAQVDNHVFVERGSTTELTWKAAGDYTGYDSLYFVVKPCTSNTCARLIQKPTTKTYSSPYTAMTCTLYVDETASFNAARYYYSIYAYGPDTVWVTSGNFNLMLNGQTPTDGVATLTPYYTVALDTPIYSETYIFGTGADNVWNQIDEDSLKTRLGIDTLTSLDPGELPDSLLYTSDISDMVTKSTPQTITGQKNFSGVVKINADTSLVFGGLYQGTPIGMHKYQRYPAEYPLYIWGQLTHKDTSKTGDWRIYSSYGMDWDSSTTRDFTNYVIAYNGDRKGNKPWMATAMEPEYEVEEGDPDWVLYEWWYQFDWPAANPQYTNRPFQITQFVPYSGNADSVKAEGALVLDQLWMGNSIRGAAANTLDFHFLSGSSYVNIADTFYFNYQVNNLDWLKQSGFNGTAISLMKVDNDDNISIAPDGYSYKIKLNKPTVIPESTIPDSITGSVILYNEKGSLKAVTGTGERKNLTSTIIPIDTGGVKSGEWYADKNSGVMSIRLPVNLGTNGEFEDWTGTFKAQTPDDWDIGVQDSTHWYLEESPANMLHYVSDADDGFQGQVSQTLTTDSGGVYTYSIYVASTIDSFLVVILGNNLWIDEPGIYSDQVIATGADYNTIRFSYYGNSNTVIPADFTLDYIRIYEIEGAIQAPVTVKSSPINILNPTDSDTVSLGRKEIGATYDSLFVYDILDSVAVQVFYRDGTGDHNLITTVDTLTTDTTITFNTTTVPVGAKVYLYVVFVGDSEAYLRSQIYWRE